MPTLNIPVGVSDFSEIRQNGYYYVDKTELIRELLKTDATKVTLITRPRRFGKTLGMSMLASFFDIRKDNAALFENLKISKETAICNAWMNQYPTIFLTFKDVDGLSFSSAYAMLSSVITELYKEHLHLLDSDRINSYDKKFMKRIIEENASETDLKKSIALLTRFMQLHYQKPVILLLDEYDVPVAKASSHGYYAEMLEIIKSMMSTTLKDNPALRMAVITGCLKIAKESICTGTNNFVSDTITDSRLNEYFGFTQKEMQTILTDADVTSHADDSKHWYDGYHFGDFDVYCPWDVMNYLRDLQHDPDARPASYWRNTIDNAIIRSFIDYAGPSITKKLETLLSGGYIIQKIEENLTYDYLHSSEDNLWSILYLTGYLTQYQSSDVTRSLSTNETAIMIPNAEIREIFEVSIMKWFDDTARTWNRQALFSAVWSGDCTALTEEINKLLRKTISYHDYREDFYHAFLAGIFTGAGYLVESNKEHGEGRSDIAIYDPVNGQAAVFEVKYSKDLEQMESLCEKAISQIDARMYAQELTDDHDHVFCFGIVFFKKRCLIKQKKDETL